MLSEKKKRKRKVWSEKWYLKRNVSCDVHLLNELLETDVPWDDAIVVAAGKLRKLWDSLSELRSSLYERRLERQFWGLRYCLSKLRSLLSLTSGMTSHSKIAQFNWECVGRFRLLRIGRIHLFFFSSVAYSIDNEVRTSACRKPFTVFYRGVENSLARPTSRCILFDGENISFDASLVLYIYI
jgi:hypothetical protein